MLDVVEGHAAAVGASRLGELKYNCSSRCIRSRRSFSLVPQASTVTTQKTAGSKITL